MNLRRSHFSVARDHRGVALVITLILLAVITFMAVTFLVLSNAEKAAAGTVKDQTVARNANDAAREHFAAHVLAHILVSGNAYNAGLFVSTNFYNAFGFTNGVVDPRNVNFDYYAGSPGGSLAGNDRFVNLLNLLYDPRPPVFVVTNRQTGGEEFRYYLDINRNGRPDTNGLLALVNNNGQLLTGPNGILSNRFVGDPQWIGILERPEFPHSPSNRFIARFCYVAVPIGNSLDINYIHNLVGNYPNTPNFLRNQGVGPWEINLGSFLADLNTNVWRFYDYRPSFGVAAGDAFFDASYIYNYRIQSNLNSLLNISTLYGGSGASTFTTDDVDGYGDGNLLVGPGGITETVQPDLPARPWPGSENANHVFNHQDFFDTSKFGPFATKLNWLTTSNSTYDSTTFFRLIEQAGTDSAPDKGKMNLNYDNLVARNPATGTISETNFYRWTPLTFFTNAADRLLKAQFGFGVDHIPVYTNSTFVYTPAVHRCLQIAANMAEVSATNGTLVANSFAMPNVFQPLVLRTNNNEVYIVGYREVGQVAAPSGSGGPPELNAPLSLADSNAIATLTTTPSIRNIYGVPWVIGARKGLPNFNEFALQSTFQITRKLQMSKPNFTSYGSRAGWQTNLMFVIGVSNAVGVEVWNPYLANFNRNVDIYVDSDVFITLTNNSGFRSSLNYTFPKTATLIAGQWTGWKGIVGGSSFQVPLRTNMIFLPDSVYRFQTKSFLANQNLPFESPNQWPGGVWPLPEWGLSVTNRLRVIMRDRDSQRILDYVQLDNLNGNRDLGQEIKDPDKAIGFNGQWATNRLAGSLPQGIYNQIDVSLGNSGGGNTDWTSFGLNQPTGDTKNKEIDKFRVFNGLSPIYFPAMTDTNFDIQVPFTPTKRVIQYVTWQANDPLIHYLPGDMATATNEIRALPLSLAPDKIEVMKNLGQLNDRFDPWGGNTAKTGGQGGDGFPNAYKTALKDPMVRKPDDWDFPTNKFPNVGWLGRVHRGSPWQTVYLKADDVDDRTWRDWSGNFDERDARISKPKNDRILFDIFTATIDENITRGLLPVNQTNLAAWSAVFGGVIALNVTNSGAGAAFSPVTIEPVALAGTNGPLARIYAGINRSRNDTNVFANQTFNRLGDVLSVTELTDTSPFLPDKNTPLFKNNVRDNVYEWLPQQVMGLLKFSEPRYVIYTYGQSLKPAPNSIVTGGSFFGLCTNYQVTAEFAARSILRVENPRSDTPQIVLENYNILSPD